MICISIMHLFMMHATHNGLCFYVCLKYKIISLFFKGICGRSKLLKKHTIYIPCQKRDKTRNQVMCVCLGKEFPYDVEGFDQTLMNHGTYTLAVTCRVLTN